jgi:hypothetical protein
VPARHGHRSLQDGPTCWLLAGTVAGLLAAPAVALGQSITATDSDIYSSAEPARTAKEGKIIHALRITGAPPRVDGRLDDAIWNLAQGADSFVQWEPDNMSPLSERTVIKVAYDDRALYIAAYCYDRTPAAIAAGLGRRDDFPPTDLISVGLDTRHDHLTGYAFQVNPSGTQGDFFFYDDEKIDRDYDAVWDVRTSTNAEGWYAEYRIPFSQLRFDAPPSPRTVWGMSSRRTIRRRAESGEWIGRPRGEKGSVSRWGHLVFDDPLHPPRRVELLPYSLARQEVLPHNAGTNPGAGAGADLRVGIGTGSTLSATINPDFGQVEQDPAVLNLTVFETFFAEKRPFFMEDSRTFVPPYQLFQLFNSRRIGRTPDRFPLRPSDVVVERPEQTTIIGAAKFSGKASGWTYGTISAVTASESAHLNLGEKRLVEPRTSYSVARVQRDIRRSSNIGALATATVRDGSDDAYTGGIDYNFRWDRNRSYWDGTWAATQAPGAGGVKNGFGGLMDFGVLRKHVSATASFDHLNPTFRVNDLGFLRNRVNRTQTGGTLIIEQPDPWKRFRRIGTTFGSSAAWNDDRLVFSKGLSDKVSLQFRNFWAIDVTGARDFEVLDDLDTRGGPPIVVPARTTATAVVTSDTRNSWKLTFTGSVRRDAAGGSNNQIGPELRLQPSSRLQASISSTYTFGRDIAQWIVNRDVTGDGVADNVYGTLDRDVVDVTFRSTYSINRDLTFQLYLQPFVAVGDYSAIRRLARPRSFDFAPVSLTTNPDFNRKSLRGNIVLRWEYLRGSTLYLVWNMATTDTSRPGAFSAFRDLGDAFGAPGTHVFMVKASYWLSR